MLPLPTSGSNDWANDGTAIRLSKVAIASVFFISFSVYLSEPILAFSRDISPFFCTRGDIPRQLRVPIIRSVTFAYLLRRTGPETFLRMGVGD
jgi:hypothetical protein